MSYGRDLVFISKQPFNPPENEQWADDWTPKGWIMANSNIAFFFWGGGGAELSETCLREALFLPSKRWASHIGSL